MLSRKSNKSSATISVLSVVENSMVAYRFPKHEQSIQGRAQKTHKKVQKTLTSNI